MNVVRDRGVIARQVMEGDVENVYRLQIMNATESSKHIQIQLAEQVGVALLSNTQLILQPAQDVTLPVTVRMTAARALTQAGQILPLDFELVDERNRDSPIAKTRSTFVVPE